MTTWYSVNKFQPGTYVSWSDEKNFLYMHVDEGSEAGRVVPPLTLVQRVRLSWMVFRWLVLRRGP